MKLEDAIKSERLSNPWDKAYLNIVFTGNWLSDRTVQVLKPHGINDQHYNILRVLKGRSPESACPGEVKEVLLNKRGDLTRLLDKLVTTGWVERQQNPENRRKIDLNITKQGLRFLDDIHKEVERLMEVTSGLKKEEVESLNNILDKIRS